MSAEQNKKYKRNVAYKLRVGDIQMGKPVSNEKKLQFLELGNKKIYRVNVSGNIVDKYHNDEKNFIFFTVDDGSGQMQVKAFGEDLINQFKDISHGETVVVIGVLRTWNDNIYISPEIMRKQDPKYLMVRKLEVENERDQETTQPQQSSGENQESQGENQAPEKPLKDKVLEMIKNAEDDGGIEKEKVVTELREASPKMVNEEIQNLLEEGIVFEPRPGKVRYLG